MGEPGQWLTARGRFDGLHLQSHLKVTLVEQEKSITIPSNVPNWPSQKRNSQVNVVDLVLNANWSFDVRCWCGKAVSHYFCRRGDMSTPALIDVRFYTLKLLRPSVLSRVFRQLRGQTRQFHGPAVRLGAAPPPPRSVPRQASDKVCGRDLFKTPSSSPTSRRRGGNSVHAGRRRERETPRPRLITSVKLEILWA